MNAAEIIRQQDGAILTLKIHRPEKKNALTHNMYAALARALQDADQNEKIRCVVITGTEDFFTSGNDLTEFMASPPASFDDAPVAHFLHTLNDFTKPLLAAVNGIAIGIGTTMLLHCDFIFAGDNSRFQMPFVNLGLCPEGGSSYILPRLVGHTRAAELLLLCKEFNAQEALNMGLINEVTQVTETLSHAYRVAEQLTKQPPAAVRLSKKLLKQSQHKAIRETLDAEGREFFARLDSPEAKEAFSAFKEKRKPNFDLFS